MDILTSPANLISVLVVDGEPLILISIARILDASGMRALLARNGREAIEIAERNYIPIDLILTNAAILELHEPELLDRLRQIRPGVRHLCMASYVYGGIARIQLITSGSGVEPTAYNEAFVESIRKAVNSPFVLRAGRPN